MDKFRRQFLAVSGLGLAAFGLPKVLLAQSQSPIRFGMVVPLTGATSQFGATMGRAAQLAAQEINAGGGILGRPIEVLLEDDQSNPEAAVRAARKLIDVDKVVAIGGSYASSVTSAIAPLCWQNKVVLATSSGADSITQLPHQGYIFRTSPTTTLQGTRLAEYAVELKCKSVFFMGPQTPFAQSYIDNITRIVSAAGAKMGGLIYEDKKANYRSEVDQALRAKPDMIILGGYVPDTAVVLKDLYRAGYDGRAMGLSFGVNQKLLEALTGGVGDGTYSLVPSASVDSLAYKRLIEKMKVPSLDTYSCQLYDHVNLFALAVAHAKGDASGTAIRDNIRKISQDKAGVIVDNATDGMKLLAEGKECNYDGASGPCEFAANGDVEGVFFRYEQIQKGKLVTVKVA
ncbi:ABC transporter substrate-binding protein [Achromobacter seleniivolatilans]|uniref:ABC transporter substrate-binding protein n=1 Tax=Achromobacter seleniivolatilans TaxID=3047478 RepID=A0ABY9M604_9BURK|nr:ABC transporter substrate-binding protein [Achromobacter sp. R39]WMD22137.1 ABC transporter substrate-binding protein [Achromobacter sp. R39]